MPRRHRLMLIVCAHVGQGLFWEHTGVKMQRLFGHLGYSVEDLWPAHWFSHRGALKKYWLLKYLGESAFSLFVLIFARYNTENSTFLPHSVVCKDKETYAAQFCVLHTKDWFEESITPNLFFTQSIRSQKKKWATYILHQLVHEERQG